MKIPCLIPKEFSSSKNIHFLLSVMWDLFETIWQSHHPNLKCKQCNLKVTDTIHRECENDMNVKNIPKVLRKSLIFYSSKSQWMHVILRENSNF